MKQVLSLSLLLAGFMLSACGNSGQGSGVINRVVGSVEVLSRGSAAQAEPGMKLEEGDTIRTGQDSTAVVFLHGGSVKIEIQPGSEYSLSDLSRKTRLTLTRGTTWTLVEKLSRGASLVQDGVMASVGVRGTSFYMFDMGGGLQGVCNCAGETTFTDKTRGTTGRNEGDSLTFMKDGKTITLSPADLRSIDFRHNHSTLDDSPVGRKAVTSKEEDTVLMELVAKRFSEAD